MTPRKPKGPPLDRPDELIDTLSQVTPADIEAARASVSGTPLGALLDAELIEEDLEPVTL